MKLFPSSKFALLTLAIFSFSQAAQEADAKEGAEQAPAADVIVDEATRAAISASAEGVVNSLAGIGNAVTSQVDDLISEEMLARKAFRAELKAKGYSEASIWLALQEHSNSSFLPKVVQFGASMTEPFVRQAAKHKPAFYLAVISAARELGVIAQNYLADVHADLKQAEAQEEAKEEGEEGQVEGAGEEPAVDEEAYLAALFADTSTSASSAE